MLKARDPHHWNAMFTQSGPESHLGLSLVSFKLCGVIPQGPSGVLPLVYLLEAPEIEITLQCVCV